MTDKTIRTKFQQRLNEAGGYVFEADDWSRLRRFLVLGSPNTYYATSEEVSMENALVVLRCALQDHEKTVAAIEDVSIGGLAKSQTPAIFALALVASMPNTKISGFALQRMNYILRTGSHLLEFVSYVDNMRGWGHALRRAIEDWYTSFTANELAYQVIKYRSRHGWTHKDVLRKAHIALRGLEADSPHAILFRWIVSGADFTARPVVRRVRRKDGSEDLVPVAYPALNPVHLPEIIGAFEAAQAGTSPLPDLIRGHGLPREAVPTDALQDAGVWDALAESMPMTALVRNLGKLESLPMLSSTRVSVLNKLQNAQAIKRSRIHPMAILLASAVYKTGHGFQGSLKWSPDRSVSAALDNAFAESFANIAPSDKKISVSLDVSSSMRSPVAGTFLSAYQAEAAIALMIARTEKNATFGAFAEDYVPFDIRPDETIDDILERMNSMDFGGTDCAVPIRRALASGEFFDAFVIFTDNQDWAGGTHTHEALEKYRKKINPEARFVVLSMQPNGHTIADPGDTLSLDIVGLSADAPAIMSNFIAGRI